MGPGAIGGAAARGPDRCAIDRTIGTEGHARRSVGYESFTAWDNDPDTPSCDLVWAPVFAAAEARSFTVSVWGDPLRES